MSEPRQDVAAITELVPAPSVGRRLSAPDALSPTSKSHNPFDAATSSDPDTCRICRGEATLEEPLFYPCKCSGSIKYVHQDCLMEWLSHSQKKHCELCKTPFRFTKLYSPEMPQTLPIHVFITHIGKYVLRNLLVWLRAALVVSVWLGWLPYLMRSVWSFLFWISDEGFGVSPMLFVKQNGTLRSGSDVALSLSHTATTVCPSSPLFAATNTVSTIGGAIDHLSLTSAPQLIHSRYGLNITSADPFYMTLLRVLFGTIGYFDVASSPRTSNTTTPPAVQPPSDLSSTLLSEIGILRSLTRYPTINRIVISVLEGQIITILVIICFILIILVRDYVVQQQPEINMRAAFAAADNPQPDPPGVIPADIRVAEGEHPLGPDMFDDDDDNDDDHDDNDEDDDSDDDDRDDDSRIEDFAQLVLEDSAAHGSGGPEFQPEVDLSDALRQPFPAENPDDAHDGLSPLRVRPPTRASQPSAMSASITGDSDHAPNAVSPSASEPSTSTSPLSAQRSPKPDTEGTTVHEYLRIYREADGDPNKILKIMRDEQLEDRLDYWVGLTKLMADRKKQPDKDSVDGEASSSATSVSIKANYAASTSDRSLHWDWKADFSPGADSQDDQNGKGKEKAEDHSDAPLMPGSPLRPRANTDGPQRPDGVNPLSNNNWSFSELTPDPVLPDQEKEPGSNSPSPDDGTNEHDSMTWFPTPPSSSPRGSASSFGPHLTSSAPDLNNEPLAGLDGLAPPRPQSSPPGPASTAGIEWDHLPDFNDIPLVRPAHADGDVLVPPRQPPRFLERLADFMWRDVEAIDVQELQAVLPENDGRFADVGQDAELGDEFERDREVVEAAVAAGLDPEAIEDAEDLEGVMELLGMRGPVAGLFQNAIFCVFLVSITIFLGVFLPYNFGRFAVWVMANPMRPVKMLFSLAKLLQDVVLVLLGAMSCAAFYLVHVGLQLWGRAVGWESASSTIASTVLTSWNMSASATRRIIDSFIADPPLISSNEIRNFSAISHEALIAVKGHIAALFAAAGQSVTFLLGGGYSAKAASLQVLLSSAGNVTLHVMKEAPVVLSSPGSWVINLDSSDVSTAMNPELAYWDGIDRFWAIAIGYFALCLVAALYLRRGTPFSSSQTGQEWEASIMDGLNQASGVMKVILIIGIEMLIFPLYCGLLLDVALLPLFEDTTLKSRMLFTVNYPLTSIFVHWFVGTGYMFHFALFVSMCRKIMRKGVLYFIRDPDDPEFHPVRDVLERNVTTQLRKILFSAFVYGALVIVCLGGVVWGLWLAAPTVLPIHYSSNEPVLEFPIDLLFYNFLMPLAVRFFKPSDALHAMYTWWFRKCARGLRVTWFLFGERRVDEEGSLVMQAESRFQASPWWRRVLLEYNEEGDVVPKTWDDTFEGGTAKPNSGILPDEMMDLNDKKLNLVQSKQLIPNGRFVRAPASDQVKIPKDKRVFLEVTEADTRLDGRLDRPETDLYSTDQYQFVYVPPYFRFRVFLFIMFIWLFAAVTGVGITVLPLVFGRRMFKLLLPAHIRTNDIYAFSIGIYTLGSISYLAFHARSIYRQLKDFVGNGVAALSNKDAIRRAAEIGFRAAKVLYSYFFLLVVFPMLASTLMELYCLIPLHTYMYPATWAVAPPPNADNPRHTVRVIQTWTLGLLYLKLGARTITSWHEDTRLAAAVRAVLRRGWLDPDAAILTRAFVIPGILLSCAAIGWPLFLARGITAYSGTAADLTPADVTLIYRLSFPAAALIALALWGVWGMVDVFKSWRVRIRDEAYLMGERLHNFGVGNGPRARRAWRAGGSRL